MLLRAGRYVAALLDRLLVLGIAYSRLYLNARSVSDVSRAGGAGGAYVVDCLAWHAR